MFGLRLAIIEMQDGGNFSGFPLVCVRGGIMSGESCFISDLFISRDGELVWAPLFCVKRHN